MQGAGTYSAFAKIRGIGGTSSVGKVHGTGQGRTRTPELGEGSKILPPIQLRVRNLSCGLEFRCFGFAQNNGQLRCDCPGYQRAINAGVCPNATGGRSAPLPSPRGRGDSSDRLQVVDWLRGGPLGCPWPRRSSVCNQNGNCRYNTIHRAALKHWKRELSVLDGFATAERSKRSQGGFETRPYGL